MSHHIVIENDLQLEAHKTTYEEENAQTQVQRSGSANLAKVVHLVRNE